MDSTFLLDLLKKEEGYYSALLALAREESIVIGASSSLEEIASLVRKKQLLLSCVKEVTAASSPMKLQWKAKKGLFPHSENIEKTLEHLRLLLEELIEVDNCNREAVKKIGGKSEQHRSC